MIEFFGPEALVAVEPIVGLFHRFGAQPAGDRAAGFVADHQPGIRQHVEMLHDRRQRHRERLGEFADRNFVGFAQSREQGPPRRIGERGKSAIEGGGLIVNHLVKYSWARMRVKQLHVVMAGHDDGEAGETYYFPIAAWISLTASSLAHSAGPAMVPISQPLESISTVVGMPKARPVALRSWNVLAFGSA